MSGINVQPGTKIGIYSSRDDYDNKKADKEYVSNGKEQSYKSELGLIIDRIKGLDGDSSNLTDKDLELAHGNKGSIFLDNLKIRRDADKGITTIEQDGKIYCFDFYVENEKTNGVKQLEKDIASGEAEYTPWYAPDSLLTHLFESDGASLFQNEITVKCPNGTTMKEIKEKYNLPDGALKSYVCTAQRATGDRDSYTVNGGCVWFSATAFAQNNGLTMDQLKDFFEK